MMKEKVGSTVYDTETAVKLGAFSVGIYGDPTGYEEQLYQTRQRRYFLYGVGGAESKYPEEKILPITAAEAKKWLSEHQADVI